MLEKYDLKGSLGAKEYMSIKYNKHTSDLCNQVYKGYNGFLKSYNSKVERDELTQPQLEEVYLHFCKQVYDTDFTNALASYFSCNEKDVYTKHSDVLVELKEIFDQNVGDECAKLCNDYYVSKGIPLASAVRMLLHNYDNWSLEDKLYTINTFSSYIDTINLEAEFLS